MFRSIMTHGLLILITAAIAPGGVLARQAVRPVEVPEQLSPLRNTQPVRDVRTLVGYTYQEGVSLQMELGETTLIPGAGGTARVERRRGNATVRVELNGMKPATGFGGDFATYVFWTVSPEGQVENVGELVLRGRNANLEATTPLQTFGMMVTAEPHALVRRPSTFIVLQNVVRRNTTTVILQPVTLEYRGYEGSYRFENLTLANEPYANGDVRTEVAQARLAIRLAERAGADTFAAETIEEARRYFYQAVDALEQRRAERVVTTYARDAIRLALDGEVRSEELRFQAALDQERADNRAELAAREAAIREARSETERARLETAQREFELGLEREARLAALDNVAAASRRAEDAEAAARAARLEREGALARMRDALSVVADTRLTTRGLIVNLPDILFDFNASALKPQTTEVLSRLCGILSVSEGYRLDIEGHTDSVGSEEYNQALSERRAGSVREYIETCSLEGTVLRSRGLGESRPIAPNDDAEGRQRNRRVEILVQDTRR